MNGGVYKVPGHNWSKKHTKLLSQGSLGPQALLSAEPGVTAKEVNTNRRMSGPGLRPFSQCIFNFGVM